MSKDKLNFADVLKAALAAHNEELAAVAIEHARQVELICGAVKQEREFYKNKIADLELQLRAFKIAVDNVKDTNGLIQAPPEDTLLFVWDFDVNNAVCRYSAGSFNDYGSILCFNDGLKSTETDLKTPWNNFCVIKGKRL